MVLEGPQALGGGFIPFVKGFDMSNQFYVVLLNAMLVMMASSQAETVRAAAGEPLRSTAAKQYICNGLVGDRQDVGVTLAKCLRGTFIVTQELQDKIGGSAKTTRLNVVVSIDDKEFAVSIARGVGVDDAGKITLSRDWRSFKITGETLGDVTIIERSHVGSKNVKELNLRTAKNVPQQVTNWSNYSEMPDYDLIGIAYYKILKPGTRSVIGYIIEEDCCSNEETEQCTLSTAKFDVEGNMIGEVDEESRGINE